MSFINIKNVLGEANLIFKLLMFTGHDRTVKAVRNIISLLVIKGGSVIISLLIVPLTINYIDPQRYGIWLTLNSLITWLYFLDLGLGSGLRNKLTDAITNNNDLLAKTYISTAYFIVTLISVFLIAFVNLLSPYFNWTRLLNVSSLIAAEIGHLVTIIGFFFSFQFVLQLINIVCLAKHNAKITALITFATSLLSLLLIFILTKTTSGSLEYLCYAMSGSSLIVMTSFSIFFYSTFYRKYSPSFRFIKIGYAKDLFQLGVKFFVINLGVLCFYFSANIVIAQVIGPDAVTPYNIAFKYFSILSVLFKMIMEPFWGSFAEANLKRDDIWIKTTIKTLLIVCIGFGVLSILMLLASTKVYPMWVGLEIKIPFSLSVIMSLYVAINIYRSIFNSYVNGVGKILLQLILVLASGLINIPLSIILGKSLGVTGVILASTILCIICAVFETIQYRRIINNRASGIWAK